MILRYANNADILDYNRYGRCAKRQYIPPVPGIGEINLYVNFGNVKPGSFEIFIVNACGRQSSLVSAGCYIIANNGKYWYGVFKGLTTTASYSQFLFAIKTTNATYFSDIVSTDHCEEISKISVCYPNNYNAEDINGAYIGKPDFNYVIDGSSDVIYQHKAWVRMAEVIESQNKVSFISNRFRNFSTTLVKQWELRTELVPGWYKDILLAIYFRGNIMINDQEALISDLDFEDVDIDYWRPTAILKKELKGAFGCAPITCLPECVCYDVEINSDFASNYTVYEGYELSIAKILSGTAPIYLTDIILPDFLEISFDGTNIIISGTPGYDAASATPYPVSFKISNSCSSMNVSFGVRVYDVPPQPVGNINLEFRTQMMEEEPLTAQFQKDGLLVFDGGIPEGETSPYVVANALEKFTTYTVRVHGPAGLVQAWIYWAGNSRKLSIDPATGWSAWTTITTDDQQVTIRY